MKKHGTLFFLVVFTALMALLVGVYWQEIERSVDAKDTLALGGTKMKYRETLKVLLWKGYIPDSVHKKIQQDLNINIEVTTFDSDAEFKKHLNLHGNDDKNPNDPEIPFDIIMPTDYMVLSLAEKGLIEKINYDKIPNYRNIAMNLRRQDFARSLFDYSVPYIYGSLGIGYNYWEIGNIVFNWKMLFEPQSNTSLKGLIAISPDARISLGIALLAMGKSPNSTDEDEVQKAGEYLKTAIAKYDIRMMNSGMGDMLASQDLLLTMAWSGEIAEALNEDPDVSGINSLAAKIVRFSLPDEGALVYFDALAIPKTSTKQELALEYINCLLDPFMSADVTNYSYFATVNQQAEPYVKTEIVNGPAYFLPTTTGPVFIRQYLGDDEKIYDTVWRDVMRFYFEHLRKQNYYKTERSQHQLWKF
ncbi:MULTISPECIES: polyamine ABC transporter substrate-binding protein [unclassified Hahella]|uniref:polyamine ABC transporter substrate-binding protein n=1 Tax=unclassified Hahella TaxID=2624107 RepID=UPI001C1E9128|nr:MULTISPECIES: spermidine/putrescine ABC transporter substrate-binding protein [unclassified Hahella]MBU6954462.1 spermidine/putrescine ABC transporter substrate-binding protein [Hahella sp. HN01]MDG9667803.1 spermidine/putrescine ABC transporter substrate-binding protein [Hahella sp. CR1]